MSAWPPVLCSAHFLRKEQTSGQVVFTAGGFPCRDVSCLNKHCAGAGGARFGLFREFIRVTRLVMRLVGELGMQFIGLGECIRMDRHDRLTITGEVGRSCFDLCASGCSRVHRPRLY